MRSRGITVFQAENNINVKINKIKITPLTLDTPKLLLFGAIYLLQTLFLPVSMFMNMNDIVAQFISLIAFMAAYFVYSKFVNSSPSSISLILAVVICLLLGSGVILLAMSVSLIFSVCTLSYILGTKNKTAHKIIFSTIPVISWLIAALLLRSFLLSALTFFHIPAALLLAYAIAKKRPRVSSICHVSAGFIISVFAIAAIFFFLRHGTNIRILPELIANAKETLTNLYYNFLSSEYFAPLAEQSLQMSATDMMTIASSTTELLFIFLPAILVTATNILAFFVHSITLKILLRTQKDTERVMTMFSFDMTILAAIVFLVSFMVSALMSESELSVLSVGMSNIAIIFMPGLIYTAIMTANTFLAMKPSCLGTLLYLALIFATINFAPIMFPLVSVAGAVIIVVANIAKYRLLKKNK